jgi:hypothetical protein
MYVRSHIDHVSGDRKYIYLDENKKKYIKDKHKYYPIKKYKGVYSLQKKRGGAPSDKEEGFIDVVLLVYNNDKDTKDSIEEPTEYTEYKAKIDMNDIILDYEDKTYKDIVKDKIIRIFNKNYNKIKKIFDENYKSDTNINPNINHFIIKKTSEKVFEVYFKKYTTPEEFKIDNYKQYYNIIYKRDNKIDKYSNTDSKIDEFLTIFSMKDETPDVIDSSLSYKRIKNLDKEGYSILYKSTLDKLKQIFL